MKKTKKGVWSPNNEQRNGKDEMNLSEFPFAVLHPNDKRKEIVFEQWTTEKGKQQYMKWSASTNTLSQLPSEFGVRVFIALLTLAAEQGWQERVYFTIYRILQMLATPTTKHYYERTKEELVNLEGVNLSSENAFWDTATKKRMSIRSFHLLDRLELLYGMDEEEGKHLEVDGVSFVVLGQYIRESAKKGNLKLLNLRMYNQLRRPLSRQLYRFLDKQMRYRDRLEIDVFDLGNRLGMARRKYPSKVIEKLSPAFDELIDNGFLSIAEPVKRGKYTRIRFVKGSGKQTPDEAIIDEAIIIEDHEEPLPKYDLWATLREKYQTTEKEDNTWNEVLIELQLQLPDAAYNTFVARTILLSCEDGETVIGVASSMSKEWLAVRLKEKIEAALKHHYEGEVNSVSFVVPEKRESAG